MKIAVGSDHRGFKLKERICKILSDMGHNINDLGTFNEEVSVDYPDYGLKVATMVSQGECESGILVCGTGIGMSLIANKVQGIRAALCHDNYTIEMSRRHNDANILCIGSDVISQDNIEEKIRLWIETEFEGGRHKRRVDKIVNYEKGNG